MSPDPAEERRRDAGLPIPAQDRLWRHPSELGLQGDGGPRIVLHRRPSRGRVLLAAAVGLVGGSVLGIGALAASGTFDTSQTTTVVEQVAAPATRSAATGELAVADAALPAVARISVSGPAGATTATGVVVRDDGIVLTTSDVLDAAESVTVTLEDGTAYPATVVGRDRTSDLGVLDIEAADLPVAALPDARLAEAVGFGDQVVVVGTTPGTTAGPLVASGYVTAPSAAVSPDGDSPMYGMVGVHLAPGTARPAAGSLLLDANGSLIGVATDRIDPTADEDSVAVYATPFDHARRVYQQVVDSGTFTPPELPVEITTIPDDEQANGGGNGVVVATEPTNPLGVSAGLRAGDVIRAINDVPVGDVNDQRTEVRRYVPGDEVEVTVVRNGEVTKRTVTLGDDPRLQ